MPRTSVVIPAFNAEMTIARTIESALAQDYADAEIIVVNDGSTDSTGRILESYGSAIVIINQANRGASAARNTGAAAARGEDLAFLDADDIWAPDKLTRLCAALDRNRSAALAFSDFRRVLSDGQEVDIIRFGSAPLMEEMLSRRSAIIPSTVVMRKSVFELCGGFCTAFRRNYFEDPFMWMLAREQGEFEYVPAVLLTYRMPRSYLDDNYFSNGALFISLVRRRYGDRAAALIADTYDHLARLALEELLRMLDQSDRTKAVKSFLRIMRLKPTLLVDPELRVRLFERRNLARLLRALRIPARVTEKS